MPVRSQVSQQHLDSMKGVFLENKELEFIYFYPSPNDAEDKIGGKRQKQHNPSQVVTSQKDDTGQGTWEGQKKRESPYWHDNLGPQDGHLHQNLSSVHPCVPCRLQPWHGELVGESLAVIPSQQYRTTVYHTWWENTAMESGKCHLPGLWMKRNCARIGTGFIGLLLKLTTSKSYHQTNIYSYFGGRIRVNYGEYFIVDCLLSFLK